MADTSPVTRAPRVEACIQEAMGKYAGGSSRRDLTYYQNVHQDLAPLARELENALLIAKHRIAELEAALASRPAEVDDASAKAGGQVGVAQAETRMDTGFQPAVAPAPEVDDEGLPAVLFDGHAVYSEITRALGKTHCHNHETVSATLDAVVRLMRQGQRDAVAADRARREKGGA